METVKMVELARIQELKILHNVRLVHQHDLNHTSSTRNLHVQFDLQGDVRGTITCHLCLDNHELSESEKNYIFPLFTESMNILVGRQISLDDEFRNMKIRLSSPRLSMISRDISTTSRSVTQKYELDLDSQCFAVLVEYSLEGIN